MSSEERKKILQMVEEGKITAEQAASLMRAMEADQDQPEAEPEIIQPEITAGPAGSDTSAPEFEEVKARARRWAMIPLWTGVIITIFSAWGIYGILNDRGTSYWWICLLFPLFIGILLIAIGAGGPGTRWLYVNVDRRYFHAGPYFVGNIGIFEPSDYYADYYGTYYLSGYSSGLSGNAGFGSRLSPFAAIEGTVGYFAAERGSDEASVVPVTIGGRLILPHPVYEPYMGAGIGVYFASLKEPPFFYSSSLYYPGTDDDDTTIGGYISLGMDFWLSPKIALNLEVRYQMVEPTFTDSSGYSYDLDMSGWELNFGFRVQVLGFS